MRKVVMAAARPGIAAFRVEYNNTDELLPIYDQNNRLLAMLDPQSGATFEVHPRRWWKFWDREPHRWVKV